MPDLKASDLMIKRLVISSLILSAIAALSSCVTAPPPPDPADLKEPYRNGAGWTVFSPSPDSRIIYVSSNQGNDRTGEIYESSDPRLGQNPRQPVAPVKAFKTFAAAFEQTREGHPDWILLKRGDTFYTSVAVRNGRSKAQPFLLASYGTAPEMPLVKPGTQRALEICCESFNHIALQGIDFYAHSRDFDSPDFVSTDGSSGFYILVNRGHYGINLLIEGCKFRSFAGNVIQAGGRITDVVFRRNMVLDSYSTKSHSQGLFARNLSMTLEDNIFDHNGWYRQQQTNQLDNRQDGQATMFNHNTYFEDTYNVLFRNNIFLRPSSMGSKWTANSGKGSTRNIEIDNNLYIDGEIGISMGGNKKGPLRFKDIRIHDNVLVNLGQSMATNRDFAWYLEIKDWDEGSIDGNVLIHPGSTTTDNIFALKLSGTSRSVDVFENLIYGFDNGYMMSIAEDDNLDDVKVFDNTFYFPKNGRYFVRAKSRLQGITFYSNRYLSESRSGDLFSVDGQQLSAEAWKNLSNEKGSEFSMEANSSFESMDLPAEPKTFAVKPASFSPSDNNRTPDMMSVIEAYHAALGKPASMDSFIQELRRQSYPNWNSDYTAGSVNDWIRQNLATRE
jgi:hypothetical protein